MVQTTRQMYLSVLSQTISVQLHLCYLTVLHHQMKDVDMYFVV